MNHYGALVYETLVPRNVRLGEAPSFGKPIIQYDPYCTGSAAYRRFAKEFMDRRKDEESTELPISIQERPDLAKGLSFVPGSTSPAPPSEPVGGQSYGG